MKAIATAEPFHATSKDPRNAGKGSPHCHAHDHEHAPAADAPLAADALVSARGLWLTRSGRTILEGIDLDITRGEIVTLIGPNGAGKTTLVRVLLGLMRADGGTARLLGRDPWADATRLHHRLAYVPGPVRARDDRGRAGDWAGR